MSDESSTVLANQQQKVTDDTSSDLRSDLWLSFWQQGMKEMQRTLGVWPKSDQDAKMYERIQITSQEEQDEKVLWEKRK